jgi:hypothetical protein
MSEKAEALAKADAAERDAALAAEQKAERDARYAARKAEKKDPTARVAPLALARRGRSPFVKVHRCHRNLVH